MLSFVAFGRVLMERHPVYIGQVGKYVLGCCSNGYLNLYVFESEIILEFIYLYMVTLK